MLIIEDGSNVANANSFATDAEFTAWGTLYGHTLPLTVADRDVAQLRAFIKLNTYDTKLSGTRLDIDQTGIYPRLNATARGFDVAANSIPNAVKVGQMLMAVNIADGATTNSFVAGASGSAGSAGGALASFEVSGVYKETYQAGTAATVATDVAVNASFPAVEEVLSPYFIGGTTAGTTASGSFGCNNQMVRM